MDDDRNVCARYLWWGFGAGLLLCVLALCSCDQAPSPTVPLPGKGWESLGVPSGVGAGIHRLEVPGGWIVTRKGGEGRALVFVPDPEKAWKY